MVLEVVCNEDSVKKLEKFLNTNKYKELAESTMSFNRKLNEERKTRLPYVDSQTGVAQRHFNCLKRSQDRMPGLREGQIVSYPQKRWAKKRYQYLHYFMVPKHLRSDLPPPGETGAQQEVSNFQEDNSNGKKDDWGDYYDDETYAMQEPIGSEPESDSDFEYESGRRRGANKRRSNKGRMSTGGGGGGRSNRKRNFDMDERSSDNRSMGRNSRRSAGPPVPVQMPTPPAPAPHPPSQKAHASDYCDFCLGDHTINKKSGTAEELIACAICGRAGHPTCLQFTENMKVAVKKYPWQCIECKSCTICGTSENDDKLLFCDDCDRGYHMYCLTPPIREAPEGSWSCGICIATFHRK